MNIIIIGCGRLGSTLANELSNAGHNISVIDHDNDRLSVLGSGFNGVKIKGIEYDDEILHEAGICSADAILSVTPDENINITVSLIARDIYHVPRIIARIVNTNRQNIYEHLNIETINPIELGVDLLKAKIAMNRAGAIQVIHRDYGVAEVTVTKDREFEIGELENIFDCVISGVIRDDTFCFPQKSETVKKGETIVCTIHKRNLDRLVSAI